MTRTCPPSGYIIQPERIMYLRIDFIASEADKSLSETHSPPASNRVVLTGRL